MVQLQAGQEHDLASGSEFVVRAGRVELVADQVYDLTAGLSFAGNLPGCRAGDAFHWAWVAVRGGAELVNSATGKVVKRVEGASLWEFEQERPGGFGMRVRVWRPFPEALKVCPVPEDPYTRWCGYNGRVEELGVLSSPVRLQPGRGALVWSSFCGGPDGEVEFAVAPRKEGGLAVYRVAAHLPAGHFFVAPPDGASVRLIALTDAFVVVRRAAQDGWGEWKRIALKEGDELRAGQGSLLTLLRGDAQTADDFWCLNSRYRGCPRPLGVAPALRQVNLRPGSLLFVAGDMRITAGQGGAEFLVRGPCAVNAEVSPEARGWRWQRVVIPAGSGQAVLLGPGSEAVVPIPWSAKAQAGPGGGLADLGEGKDLRQDECVVRPTLVMAPRGDGRGLVVNQPLFEGWIRGPYSLVGGEAK